jgi:cell division protein FtsW
MFYVLAVVFAVFIMFGLVMVLSASSINQFRKGNSPWRLFNRQAMWAGLGLVGLWFAMRTPMRLWRRFVYPALIVCMSAMLLPFFPGVGLEINGARAWVGVGGFTFQPSEFLKLAVLLGAAQLLASRHDEMAIPRRTLWPVLGIGTLGAGLCLAQSDLGSAIVLMSIVFAVAFIGGAPLIPMTGASLVAIAAGAGFVVSSPRRLNRFTAFLDIAGNKDFLSFQTYQAMISIGQGGLTGQGIGRGLNKLGDFVPLAHSDFIFAVIAEELGLVGVVVVIGGFLAIAYGGVQVALATHDRLGSLIAGGIVSWLVVQAIINIGGVTGVMPVTGLTLPFFSAGGTSLFVTMVSAGLMLNIARNVR